MNRNLHEKIGSVEFEKLFAGIEPPAIVKPGTIEKLGTKATLKRGTLLTKNAAGKLIVCGSDVDATGTFTATGNGTAVKFDLVSGGVIPAALTEVKVDGTAMTSGWTYNAQIGELEFESAPADTKTIAVKYTVGGGNPDCVLCDDIEVGTAADENAAVYVSGCFNESALIVAENYTLTEADRDILRTKGILLGTVQEP